MMSNGAIALTDYDWYSLISQNYIDNYINFWTPTPWNIRKLNLGDKVYFLLKKKYGRKICGYGCFVKYETNDILNAWNEYGLGNGVRNLEELKRRVAKYTNKNSKIGYQGENHLIGCLILNHVSFFPREEQKSPDEYNWIMPKNIVKFKYITDEPTIIESKAQVNNSFSLVSQSQAYISLSKSKRRVGQATFRYNIMEAYKHRCCVTGETAPQALQAAHIQEYINEESNHIQNGLLLRADLHILFDSGLISINDKYEVLVSSHLTSKYYRQFVGLKIELPAPQFMPSLAAIKWHNENVYRK